MYVPEYIDPVEHLGFYRQKDMYFKDIRTEDKIDVSLCIDKNRRLKLCLCNDHTWTNNVKYHSTTVQDDDGDNFTMDYFDCENIEDNLLIDESISCITEIWWVIREVLRQMMYHEHKSDVTAKYTQIGGN